MARFYQASALSLGEWEVEEATAHHILHVLRLKMGESIILLDGSGSEFKGSISKIVKKKVFVVLEAEEKISKESKVSIHLIQAISRRERMDLSLQKAVELGVTEITPILSDFCNVKKSKLDLKQKEEHWRGVMISATEQSGRAVLTRLNPVLDFPEMLNTVSADLRLCLSPQGFALATTEPKPQSIAVLVGAEGGLSEREEQQAHEAGFLLLSLGPRILRTETAGLVAISILQHRYGDLGS